MQKYLMILSSSGIPIFTVSYACGYGVNCDDITDPIIQNSSLFSAFLGGLFGISSELGGHLEHITISNLDIFAFRLSGVISVLITEPTESVQEQDNYKNKVRLISELFHSTYEYYIKNERVHDTSVFYAFQKILEDADLADENSKFKKNCQECVFDKGCPFRIISGDPKLSIKERISRIPKNSMFTKMKQMFKAMKIYRPISDDAEDTPHNSVLSLSIYNKVSNNTSSIGYGCNNKPFYEISSFESEFIKGEITDLMRVSVDHTEVKVKFSPLDKKIAYGLLNSLEYAIIVQFQFVTIDNVEKILKDIMHKILSLQFKFDESKADFIEFQVLEENKPISFCLGCLDDSEVNCFSKNILKQFNSK